MEVPQIDYNKSNLRWTDRICRENRVNGTYTGQSFEPHTNVGTLQGKINNLPSPYEYCKKIVEYIGQGTEQASAAVSKACSPRGKYLIPQSSSQDFGWALAPPVGKRVPVAVVTGLYNWHRSSKAPEREPSSMDHTLGYVDRSGEYSHPKRVKSFSLDTARKREPTKTTIYNETELQWLKSSLNYPGDHHLRPHEWAFLCSNFREASNFDLVEEHGQSNPSSGVSIPTTVVREVDKLLRAKVGHAKEFMNRIGSNKWYHPLTMNDVSLYGDAYVKSMHCGPHSKSQLLISR